MIVASQTANVGWMRLLGPIVICALACGSDQPTAPDAMPPPPPTSSPCDGSTWPNGPAGWEVVCGQAEAGQLLSVWGSAPDDVYFVGGRAGATGGDGQAVVWHWDGDEVTSLATPGNERAWWVFGTDADHVYVVGERGLGLQRINGGPFEPFDTGTEQTVYGIWGATPDRLYAVSGDFSADGRGLLHEITPDGASVVADSDLAAFTGKALFKVWGAAADDVFASGELGALFHFDGTSWTRMPSPSEEVPILTLSGAATGPVYGVGGRGRGTIWEYRDGAWSDHMAASASIPGLMGVRALGNGTALVTGEDGTLATYVDGAITSEGLYTSYPLHAVWHDTDGGAWAVGGNFLHPVGTPPAGVLLRKRQLNTPAQCVSGPGYHHLDLQGRSGTPLASGSYPMYDMPRGVIHPSLVHGEHYLLGRGAYVEFTIPLCDDISDQIALRLPNNDDPGAVALHQLFIVRDGQEFLVAQAIDDVPGSSGYIPFDRSSLPAAERAAIADTVTHPTSGEKGWAEFADAPGFATPPTDILARTGDTLLLRTTNISDKMYGLMIWYPQNGLEYQSFIEVHVPDQPGGEEGVPTNPPPKPGPCAATTASSFVELGVGTDQFAPLPAGGVPVVLGPQGSLMFQLAVRGRGFSPGSSDPLADDNPYLAIDLALDQPASTGGRIIADGAWRRGFTRDGDDLVLTDVIPTVPVGATNQGSLVGSTVYAELVVVDVPTGTTFCQQTSFTVTN